MTRQLLDIVSRSTERKLNRELINCWHTARDQEFCMYFGLNGKRHPAQPIAKQNVPDACWVQPKVFPALILSQRAGDLHIKALSLSKIKSKERKRYQNEFFHNSGNGIKDSRNGNRCRRGSMGRYQPAGRIRK